MDERNIERLRSSIACAAGIIGVQALFTLVRPFSELPRRDLLPNLIEIPVFLLLPISFGVLIGSERAARCFLPVLWLAVILQSVLPITWAAALAQGVVRPGTSAVIWFLLVTLAILLGKTNANRRSVANV